MTESRQQDREARPSAADVAGPALPSTTADASGRPPEGPVPKERNRSLWGDALRDLVRNPVFLVSVLVALAIVSMAAFPSLWTGIDPNNCSLQKSKVGPTAGHPFGFTVQGCDLYSQVIYGARASIVIATLCTAGVFLIGVTLGSLAAFYGGFIDTVISRLTDIVFGLPLILGGILFLSIIDTHSIWAITATIVILGWPQMARIMRGSVLSTMVADYIRASRALGAGNRRILLRHILPNAIAPAIVIATISLGGFVSAEATLSFLGVGLQLPAISWGLLIGTGQDWALAGYWHLLVFPCAFLIVTVLSFILIGDAVRDALDPKLH